MSTPDRDPFAPTPGGGVPPAPPQWGAPQYGQPYAYRKPSNGMGVAALVCSLVGIFIWFIGPLLGIIFGFVGRSKAKRGEATNGGLALAGIIVGVVLLLGQAGIIVAVLSSGSTRNYISCVNNANNDQAKIQQCAQQYRNSLNSGLGGLPR